MAARKVADENRKLRALLAEHGVTDDSIEKALQSGSATRPDPLLERQSSSPESVGAAYRLEHLLYPGIHDYGYQSAEVPATMTGSECNSRDHIVQPLWELTRLTQNEHVGRRYEDIYTMIRAASSSHQLMTPRSTRTCASSEILSHDSGGGVQTFDFDAPFEQSGQSAYGGDGGTTKYGLATDIQGVETDLGYLSDEDTKG